jgi:hypothetical protein
MSLIGVRIQQDILGTSKDILGTNKTTMQHDILDTEGEDDKGAAPDPKALTLVFLPVLSSINGCMPL